MADYYMSELEAATEVVHNKNRCTEMQLYCKKEFSKILQNSQENTCARVSFLINLQAEASRLWRRCFPVNFAKFLRTPFLS